MDGWVKLHRCLLDKPIWACSKVEQRVVLITILLLANHAPKEWMWKGERFTVNEGQFITSIDSLAKKAGVSRQSVRTALANFEVYDFLTNESTKTGRLITVVNWGFYQSVGNSSTKKSTKHQQSINKAVTPNKNDKHLRTEEKTLDILTDVLSEKVEKFPICPHLQIRDAWNRILHPAGCHFVESVHKTRQTNLRTRWRDNPSMQSIEAWEAFFEYIRDKCPFLMGKVKPRKEGEKPFMVSFDWVVNLSNFQKIKEGYYERGGSGRG